MVRAYNIGDNVFNIRTGRLGVCIGYEFQFAKIRFTYPEINETFWELLREDDVRSASVDEVVMYQLES